MGIMDPMGPVCKVGGRGVSYSSPLESLWPIRRIISVRK